MHTPLIIIHLMIVLALVTVVLLQRSEGGALGMGGGGGFMSSRGKTTALSRTTTYLAIGFFATSLALALLARGSVPGGGVLDQLPAGTGGGTVLEQLGGTPNQPQAPAAPPVSQ